MHEIFYQNYNKKAWPLEDQLRRKRLIVIDQGQNHLQLLDRLEMTLSSTSGVTRSFFSHYYSVAGSHSKNGTWDMKFFGGLLGQLAAMLLPGWRGCGQHCTINSNMISQQQF